MGSVGNYTYFQIRRTVIDSIIDNLKNGKNPGVDLSPLEAKLFKYGALRQT